MRQTHRNIGLLIIEIAIPKGISGILISHMNGKKPSYFTSIKTYFAFLNGCPLDQLTDHVNETNLILLFNDDKEIYNTATGFVEYEFHKKRPLFYYIYKLLYKHDNSWAIMADIFARIHTFLAISCILILHPKGRKGLRRILIIALGILTLIVYHFLLEVMMLYLSARYRNGMLLMA